MIRLWRNLALLFLIIGLIAFFFHVAGLCMLYSMDIRDAYNAQGLGLKALHELKLGMKDKMVFLMLNGCRVFGIAAAGMFLAAQMCLHINDVYYVEHYMDESGKTSIRLVAEAEKDVLGLLDRILPLLGMIAVGVLLLKEWLRAGDLLKLFALTRRTVLMQVLTETAAIWFACLTASLILSLIFMEKTHKKAKDLFYSATAEE